MNSTANETHIPPNGIGALPFTPLLVPSAVFTSIFAIFFFLHIIFAGFFRKYYGYSIGMVCGLLLEMLGYVAKVQLSHNRMNKNAYIMYERPCLWRKKIVKSGHSMLTIVGILLDLLLDRPFFHPLCTSE